MADLNHTAVMTETVARLRAQAEQAIRDSELSGGFGPGGARAARAIETLDVVQTVMNGQVPVEWQATYNAVAAEYDEHTRYYGHGRQSESHDPNRGERN